MKPGTLLKYSALALIAVPVSLGAAAVVAHGPAAAWRLVALGDSSIYDHASFPARVLRPSEGAIPMAVQLRQDVAEAAMRHTGTTDLETWLAETGTIAFVVIDGDTVAHEWYASGRSPSDISQVFSVSKSVTSALVGAAVADGIIASVDQPVSDFVPELSEAGFADITIRDLLQMRSGMDYSEEDNPFGRHVTFNYTDQLESEILALSAVHDPDAEFRYRSGDNALLGLILSRAVAPRTVTDYAQARLWEPLGMEHAGLWTLDREDGLERTWCCLAATARDLARIGMLYRDGGVWRGEQILSAAWVEASLTSAYSAEGWDRAGDFAAMSGYGFQWWLGEATAGDFAAIGKDGQFLFVDPASGMVLVRLGETAADPGMRGWIDLFRAIANKRATVAD